MLKEFTDSPDFGEHCICSFCGKKIRKPPAIRITDTVKNTEMRFHNKCYVKASAQINEKLVAGIKPDYFFKPEGEGDG